MSTNNKEDGGKDLDSTSRRWSGPLERALSRRKDRSGLSAWDRMKIARDPNRPYTLDFIRMIFKDFQEVHGDRSFADDPAMICGLAVFHGKPVAIVGHQKGRTTKQKVHRNFGMARPEGYRKALRVMRTAEKFGRPIFCFIDTPGADPGIGAEERGQSEAIAFNLREMSQLRTPIVVTVTGEGGSGGALAIGVGDRVLMMENATYSVISPEGCAAILWKDAEKAKEASESLKLSAEHLTQFGIVDDVIPEPGEGAHEDPEGAARNLDAALVSALDELASLDPVELLDHRYQRFRRIGAFLESNGDA